MPIFLGCRDFSRMPRAESSTSVTTSSVPKASSGTAEQRTRPSRFQLQDLAEKLGVSFTYDNGDEAGVLSIVESLGGGIGILDFDGDGLQDVVATGGGQFHDGRWLSGYATGLFRNLGPRFSNVAPASSIADCEFYSHGIAVGDFDNDGFSDVLITGYDGMTLHHNQGDGTFQRRLDCGFPDSPGWCSSAAWADFNLDGVLDLYVARYVNWSFANHPICTSTANGQRDICPPKSFEPLPDLLFVGDGSGGFRSAAEEYGLRTDGKGLGVLSADVDNDGDTDVYVANDTTDNFLYLNDGSGHMLEVGLKHGVAVDERALPNGSMGVAACDFDDDGWLDLWVANYEREAFAMYQNLGQGHFLHVSRRTGVTNLGGSFVGFGTEVVDLDSDGNAEIVVANGHVVRHPSAAPRRQLPLVLSHADGRFSRDFFSDSSYFGQVHEGRGLAVGDLNNDHRIDMVISHLNDPLAMIINGTPQAAESLVVRLIGTNCSRDAIGTRVVFESGGKRISRQLSGGGSYLSSSERCLRFALPAGGDELIVTVYWPGDDRGKVVRLSAGCREIMIVEATIAP